MKRKSVMALLLSLSMTTAMMGYGGAVASAESTEATTAATTEATTAAEDASVEETTEAEETTAE